MKRFVALATIAVFALAGLTATAASEDNSTSKSTPKHKSVPAHCTIGPFRAFSAAVWRLPAWERGKPPAKVIAAQRARLSCAPAGHRKAMRQTWQRDKDAYFHHRNAVLETIRWEPYVCGNRRYALPCAVTECESGYYFGHHSGAYGLLDSTWLYWGGGRYAPYPGAATPRQQAIIARKVWEAVGPSGWECPL